jgi:AraC-like DNA-binding protein
VTPSLFARDPVFLARRPSGALGRHVDSIWICCGAVDRVGKDRMLPTGTASFVVNLAEDETRIYDAESTAMVQRFDGNGFTGAHRHPFVIDTAEQVFAAGVEFRPGGAWPFFAVAQDELADSHLPLAELWGFEAERLREALLAATTPGSGLDALEAALARNLCSARAAHADVSRLLAAISRDPGAHIGGLARGAALRRRRLTRVFEQSVGMTPKRYARLVRFRRLLREIHGAPAIDWADLAAACAFYDQAHLIHEFRAFAGLSPTEYLASAHGFSNHVPID